MSFGVPGLQVATRWLLAVTTPVQGIVGGLAGLTHNFCNAQAREILRNDGHESIARILGKFGESLNLGAAWVDQGWKNVSHYYNPVTQRGWRGWPSAAVEVERYFMRAGYLYRRGNPEKAMFLLGAAGHLVQDLCVPHHAHGVIFAGHREFEVFAEVNRNAYPASTGGMYGGNWSPSRWIVTNAQVAYDFFSVVTDGNTREYDQALQTLLPVAQRSTAGLFKCFFDRFGLQENRF
ncbi:MAG: zinc dependent phospholipase C family protein [Heliobacteriaceae bacterium]|nr:zinc dependent phospholipase C family protein [Heliobacteriaceae bacterium]MDD4587269.1 zinc dependent phospholipase C family protein [Heliobacteriaceae bacterium]